LSFTSNFSLEISKCALAEGEGIIKINLYISAIKNKTLAVQKPLAPPRKIHTIQLLLIEAGSIIRRGDIQ